MPAEDDTVLICTACTRGRLRAGLDAVRVLSGDEEGAELHGKGKERQG